MNLLLVTYSYCPTFQYSELVYINYLNFFKNTKPRSYTMWSKDFALFSLQSFLWRKLATRQFQYERNFDMNQDSALKFQYELLSSDKKTDVEFFKYVVKIPNIFTVRYPRQ